MAPPLGQGGIAAVLARTHSPETTSATPKIARRLGLCNAEVTRYVVERGRQASECSSGKAFPFTGMNQRRRLSPPPRGGHSHAV